MQKVRRCPWNSIILKKEEKNKIHCNDRAGASFSFICFILAIKWKDNQKFMRCRMLKFLCGTSNGKYAALIDSKPQFLPIKIFIFSSTKMGNIFFFFKAELKERLFFISDEKVAWHCVADTTNFSVFFENIVSEKQ